MPNMATGVFVFEVKLFYKRFCCAFLKECLSRIFYAVRKRDCRVYTISSSSIFLAESAILVPGPKIALAPLSSRNL